MLHVKDLTSAKTEKAKRNHELYKKFLGDAHLKIKRANDAGVKRCMFKVPPFVIGQPLYNYQHAIRYILRKLTQGDFNTQHLEANVIYIDWKPRTEIKKRKGILK